MASIDSDEPPTFPKILGREQKEAGAALTDLPNEVRINNELSDECTVVEVFTVDRRGLLYRLARALHDLGLVIRFAKIGTYLDQVVDVFYVTERDGEKPRSDGAAGGNSRGPAWPSSRRRKVEPRKSQEFRAGLGCVIASAEPVSSAEFLWPVTAGAAPIQEVAT